jgi:hypothetical protein
MDVPFPSETIIDLLTYLDGKFTHDNYSYAVNINAYYAAQFLDIWYPLVMQFTVDLVYDIKMFFINEKHVDKNDDVTLGYFYSYDAAKSFFDRYFDTFLNDLNDYKYTPYELLSIHLYDDNKIPIALPYGVDRNYIKHLLTDFYQKNDHVVKEAEPFSINDIDLNKIPIEEILREYKLPQLMFSDPSDDERTIIGLQIRQKLYSSM